MKISKHFIFIITSILCSTVYAESTTADFRINFQVNANFTGDRQKNQDLMYDVKDDKNNIIIPMTHVLGNNATFKVSYSINDFTNHKGLLPITKYLINFYNLEAKLPNSSKLKMRLPITINVTPDNLYATSITNYIRSEMGAISYSHQLDVYGNIGYKINSIANYTIQQNPNSVFHNEEKLYSYTDVINNKDENIIMENNVNIDLGSIPYLQNYVPLKTQVSTITNSYSFGK